MQAAPIDLPTLPRGMGGTAARARLLCVEDNPVNAALLSELLEMRPGVQYMICADGESALAAANDLVPDMFLLDMHFPEMSGTRLMLKFRADARHARGRYIALSADAMPTQIEAARSAGFDAYWTKPLDVHDFLAALDDMVHAMRQRLALSGQDAR